MRATAPGLILIVLLVTGCGTTVSTTLSSIGDSVSTAPTTGSPGSAIDPLIGTWTRVNSCTAFLTALKAAGLGDLAPEWLGGGNYFANASDINPDDQCAGAREVKHSHFFTASGQFGSLDENGAQVDDATYQLVDASTIAFGAVLVHFNISADDKLSFEVVMPDPCVGACREDHAWAISAFYPGEFERTK